MGTVASFRVTTGSLLLCLLIALGSGSPAQTSTASDGLTVSAHGELLYRNRPLQPPIHANNSLEIGKAFHMDSADVILVTDNGGTACPYLYYLVTVQHSHADATPAFGTCNSVVSAERKGTSIVLTMHGYRGPFEPEAERRKASRELHTFVFVDGKISEMRPGSEAVK